jgi:hypothetical protein
VSFRLSLRVQLIVWIVGGLIVFAAAFSVIAYMQLPFAQKEQWRYDNRDESVTRENRIIYVTSNATLIKNERSQPSLKRNDGANSSYDSEQNPWQMKLSDALIAYFTYCLVIVGWVTMKSSEKTVRDIESPQIGLSWGEFKLMGPAQSPASLAIHGFGPAAADLGLVNAGKTRAYLREYYIGLRESDVVGKIPSYPLEGIYLKKIRVEFSLLPTSTRLFRWSGLISKRRP